MPKRDNKPSSSTVWQNMPWKAVDTENENLGDFDEAIFFGLEELDGDSFIATKKGDHYNVKLKSSSDGTEPPPKKVKKAPIATKDDDDGDDDDGGGDGGEW